MNQLSLFLLSYDPSDNVKFNVYDENSLVASLDVSSFANNLALSEPLSALNPGYYVAVAFSDYDTFGQENIYWDGNNILTDEGTIAQAVRDNLTTELTHLDSLENGLLTTENSMLTKLFDIMGLDMNTPVTVTQTSRTFGTVVQTIDANDQRVIIQRTA